jgi:NAD(P)-dependent dehydrogenase (short-subunit alcohol dehydrogenase family)
VSLLVAFSLFEIFDRPVPTVEAYLPGSMEEAEQVMVSYRRAFNISSFAAQVPGINLSLYSASKAAVDALSRCWALELGSTGITVNSVAPGYIATDMSAVFGDPAPIVRGVSLKRVGLPGDIAEVVAFLASDASGGITGPVLSANGGQVASVTVLKSLS